jgi:probable rRNA maturation factor
MRFEKLKDDILGKQYSLSIAYVSLKKSREINKKYREKDKATNVLAFPLYKNMGELVLCKSVVEKEAKISGKTSAEWLLFLVIHGMLHLKGMSHSSRMEKAEKLYCKKYDKEYFNRNRHGLHHDASHSGRVSKRRKKS